LLSWGKKKDQPLKLSASGPIPSHPTAISKPPLPPNYINSPLAPARPPSVELSASQLASLYSSTSTTSPNKPTALDADYTDLTLTLSPPSIQTSPASPQPPALKNFNLTRAPDPAQRPTKPPFSTLSPPPPPPPAPISPKSPRNPLNLQVSVSGSPSNQGESGGPATPVPPFALSKLPGTLSPPISKHNNAPVSKKYVCT
jgi:hypothetical protein